MTVQRRDLIALLGGVLVAAIGLVSWHGMCARRRPPLTAPASTPFAGETTTSASQRATQRARAQQLNWGRDPLHPWNSSNALGLLVSGIIWDAVQPMAVINDQTYLIGDTVDGYQILAIDPGHITCTDGIQKYRIDVAP